MCWKRWGVNWPLYARVFHWTEDPKKQRSTPYDFIQMHEQLQQINPLDPQLCICFLETNIHSMVLVHDGSSCVALDGFNHPDIKKLAGGAAFVARKMGFPETPINYPKLWDQMDDWSCGWHVLHFLKFLLLDTNNIADLRASLFSCLAQPTIFLFV